MTNQWVNKEPLLPVYRPETEVVPVIRAALDELGVISRSKIQFSQRFGVNVQAYSNKRQGGWRVDFYMPNWQFSNDDSLEQMKSAVKQEFSRVVRRTIEEWYENTDHPNFNKVMTLIVTDINERNKARLKARQESTSDWGIL